MGIIVDCRHCENIMEAVNRFPGTRINPLAESTGLGRRTVLKHLDHLHKAGKIRRANLLSDMRAVAILPLGV